jgi:signal transduction histidine kinase
MIDAARPSEHRHVSDAPLAALRISVALILVCFTQISFAQSGAGKTVLVLYDGGREFSSIQLVDRGIESTLNAALSNRVTLFREHMDLTRVRPANYEQILRDFYRAKYSSNRPDVIIAIRSRTLDFLLKHGEELFPGVPIVSSGMDLRQIHARQLPPNVTGNTLRVRYWPTLQLALTLQPETEEVAVIIGASPSDQALEMLVRDELRGHQRQLRFTYLVGLALDDLTRRVSSLSPRTVILFVSLAQDGQGRSFLPNDALAHITAAANAPTYIASDDVLNSGAVGGALISFAGLGKDTAGLAARILEGESPSNIPFVDSSARTNMVDAGQLNRWGIASSRVPAGSIILNRTPSTWETYKWRIVSGVGLIVFQSALIGLLFVQRRRRRVAEQSLQLSEARGQTAVLEERNRMARDMHDTLAQGFTGVIVQLEAAEHASAHGASTDTNAHIQRARELARQSLGEARRSIRALRPQALENRDLCFVLESSMQQMTAGTGFRAEFRTLGTPRTLSPPLEENLLRIHQELLTNALKHSGATVIRTALSFETAAVRLEVQDDGVGFDPSKQYDGFGLLGIRERVQQMEGELIVASQPGLCGTKVSVILPD